VLECFFILLRHCLKEISSSIIDLAVLIVCSASGWQIEEAKLFRAQGQNEMAINLGMYISQNYQSNEEVSDVYRLIGKWLAETRSSKLLDKLNSV
jgi:hypothetical protein